MPIYRLQAGSTQWKFHESRKKIQIFGGAFGNGKSTALIIKTLRIVRDYPGMLGMLGRATYPKLNGTLRADFIKWTPRDWIKKLPTQEDNTIYFTNGSAIQFRYVAQKGKSREDGTTTSNLLSATYDLIAIDQVEDPEISYKDFLDMLGRLRRETRYRPPDGEEDETMPSTGPRWLMLGANPAANWIYKEVVAPYLLWKEKGIYSDKLIVDRTTGDPLIELVEGSTYENKSNLPDDYIPTMEASYKGQMRDRYLLGKWAAFEGLVHPGFDNTRHLLKREYMLDYLYSQLQKRVKPKLIEGYDFGNVSPSCYIWGFVDDHGRVFLLDGFYEPEFIYSKQPAAIREIRRKYEDFLTPSGPIIADPAIFRKQIIHKRRVGTSLAEEFANLGIDMVPGDNSMLTGIAKVNQYIGGKVGVPHLLTGEDPGPLLYVAEEMPWFVSEIGSYYWKRNPQMEFTDEPVDNNDHAMNTTKYMLSKLPEPSQIVIPRSQLPPTWAYWQEMETKEYARRSSMRRRWR